MGERERKTFETDYLEHNLCLPSINEEFYVSKCVRAQYVFTFLCQSYTSQREGETLFIIKLQHQYLMELCSYYPFMPPFLSGCPQPGCACVWACACLCVSQYCIYPNGLYIWLSGWHRTLLSKHTLSFSLVPRKILTHHRTTERLSPETHTHTHTHTHT